MNIENLKLFISLIKYADDCIWQEIYEKILCSSEYDYSFYDKYSGNSLINLFENYIHNYIDYDCNNNEYDENYMEDFNITARKRVENFFTNVINISKYNNCFCLDETKENAKKFEQLIKIILKTNKFIYWMFFIEEPSPYYEEYLKLYRNNSKQYLEIFYQNIDSVKNSKYLGFGRKLIEVDKYNMYLLDGNRKCLIEKKRKIPQKMEINKFLETYEALSDSIDKLDRKYCPWCNPDDNIIHTPRQRKCTACEDIAKYLVATKKINKKQLNDNIIKIIGKDFEQTIKKRGLYLCELQEKLKPMLKNDTNLYTNIRETIKMQYLLDK